MSCLADAGDGDGGQQHRLLFDLTNNATLEFLESLYSFKIFYGQFHRFISFSLCLAGILANIVHICVLTRPEMRRSSVHTTLTCIAIADIGTMSSYLMYISRFEFFIDVRGYSLEWAEFLRMHAVISIALHAVSLYLVVFMAFIRLMALDVGQSKWMMPKRACGICVSIALLVFVVCIPTFLAHEIYERLDNHNNTEQKFYSIGFSSVFLDDGCALLKFNLWLTGSVLKAVPCFLLVVLTFALLKRLRVNEKIRRERFFKLVKKTNSIVKQPQSTASARRCAAADRTTYVLLLMLCVFLLTELPQGLFAILNAMYTYQFHSYVYMSIADVLDLLSLINCYVAFTVYILTSSNYRETLFSIFIIIFTRKKYGSVYGRNNNHTPLAKSLSSRQKADNGKRLKKNNEEKIALNNGLT